MTAKRAQDHSRTTEGLERAALERDYRAHAPWLANLARRRLGRSEDAEDLVQETYIRASRYPAKARLEPRSLLARILGNLIKDRFRANARERAGYKAFGVEGGEGGPSEADQHHMLVLKQIVLGMPAPQRDVFLLVRFTPLSQAEIATRLGISIKTVEWRLAKALAYCADRIAE
ncbi:RNA polymerase sigma factor [Sphingomonas sp. M1-B02]|uniref:RNA polymerase sigma factor n=1 Tax=Sphingomonas sp. M1-B02 TaxID=3114300 RepID=UPI002240BD29|nr:RNA polymerase sigma factor [Sphingomonas sp. S6-11]UZK67859.1 RNA polymerase sigma factor [Sphingomonas sp. S6-11]